MSDSMSRMGKYLQSSTERSVQLGWQLNHLEKRLTGVPAGLMRNFSKFQEMSDRRTGDQTINLGLPRLTPCSSDSEDMDSGADAALVTCLSAGRGRFCLRKVNTGCSASPFTSTWFRNNSGYLDQTYSLN